MTDSVSRGAGATPPVGESALVGQYEVVALRATVVEVLANGALVEVVDSDGRGELVYLTHAQLRHSLTAIRLEADRMMRDWLVRFTSAVGVVAGAALHDSFGWAAVVLFAVVALLMGVGGIGLAVWREARDG